MNYQKEYASLVGQIDRAISTLELRESDAVQRAVELLRCALCAAEEHYIAENS